MANSRQNSTNDSMSTESSRTSDQIEVSEKHPSLLNALGISENTLPDPFTQTECLGLHNFLKKYKNDKNKSNGLEELQNVLKSNPEAARIRNTDGDLPLHLICRQWFPDWLVKVVLKANIQAVEEVDKNGNLPLSIACGSYANKLIIIALCELYPQAASVINQSGNAPIHDFCSKDVGDPPPFDCIKALVDASPEMVSKPDSEGCLLIHKACDWVLAVVMLVLLERDSFFYWPQDMPELLHSLHNLKYFLKAAPALSGTAMQFMCTMLAERFDQFFHKATSLALQFIIESVVSKNALKFKSASNRHCLMISALSGKLNISFNAFQMLFGNQWGDAKLLANIGDGKKSLPLHIASQYGKDIDPCIIEHLVNLNPRAASCVDANGKIPLHLSVENGLPLRSVEAIFNACPSAVMYSSEENGFSPALIAATKDASLDVIWFLLREFPLMVRRN